MECRFGVQTIKGDRDITKLFSLLAFVRLVLHDVSFCCRDTQVCDFQQQQHRKLSLCPHRNERHTSGEGRDETAGQRRVTAHQQQPTHHNENTRCDKRDKHKNDQGKAPRQQEEQQGACDNRFAAQKPSKYGIKRPSRTTTTTTTKIHTNKTRVPRIRVHSSLVHKTVVHRIHARKAHQSLVSLHTMIKKGELERLDSVQDVMAGVAAQDKAEKHQNANSSDHVVGVHPQTNDQDDCSGTQESNESSATTTTMTTGSLDTDKKQKKKRQKSVRFRKDSIIHPALSRAEYSEEEKGRYWFSARDYAVIQLSTTMTMRTLASTRVPRDSEVFCSRGLESCRKDRHQQLQLNRIRANQSVLNTQRRLREERQKQVKKNNNKNNSKNKKNGGVDDENDAYDENSDEQPRTNSCDLNEVIAEKYSQVCQGCAAAAHKVAMMDYRDVQTYQRQDAKVKRRWSEKRMGGIRDMTRKMFGRRSKTSQRDE